MNTKYIDPSELHNRIGEITPSSNILLINVCTEAEFAEEHIANSVNIPLDKLTCQLPILAGKKVVYVHCRSGKRSAQAVQMLSQLNNVVVVDMRGGLLAWKEKGLATIQD
ncbi:rhodanese-like domain-containing protein [Candidatus Gracilibacteria bacterium]|nr:rhodanese-like domain-containing protein [Candidatus Gracilibacteria bacterium]